MHKFNYLTLVPFYNTISRALIACLVSLSLTGLSTADEKKQPAGVLDNLETIMSDPDWMGTSPKSAYWSLDSQSIFYTRKALGHKHQETYHFVPKSGTTEKLGGNSETKELLQAASNTGVVNQANSLAAFIFQGDVYIKNIASGNIKPVTLDDNLQHSVQFIDDTKLSFMVNHKIFVYDSVTGIEQQIADFTSADDPDKIKDKDYLKQSQPRLLSYLENRQAEKAFQKSRKTSQTLHPVKKYYVGKGKRIKTFRLSPDAKWLLLGTTQTDLSGKNDNMPEFVTDSGYVKNRKVRPLVGSSKPVSETFYLYNLEKQSKSRLDLSQLPAISDDPLVKLRKKAAQKIGYKFKKQEGLRAVYAHNWYENQGVEWSSDSSRAAILLYSYDNKDRWIINLDPKSNKISTGHWMSDEAWINDTTFNQFGWLPDNQTLYYLSEESGYSHLYIKKGKRKAAQLTKGQFEVSDVSVAPNGKQLFYKANKNHPGNYEVYAINLDNRTIRSVTQMGGNNSYELSPDGKQIIVSHSTTTQMPELYIQSVDSNAKATQVTDTMSEKFKQVNWQAPQIIPVPSSHTKQPIYSRLYLPTEDKISTQDDSKNSQRPAIVFVHGAGYLQNSHQGWSGYFREFMFHNYLVKKGFVVLDMDYRASKGYGRDWRTAIYRQMGTPELEDLEDGVKWLVEHQNVDAKRVGVYGGSYGGFMTFMALFKSPDLFAAGAALRPVTDWSHYNHGYTSNILNTPQVDPEAFERSSPIEFAEGLNKPLLIAHGMVDDNVFFKDSVRLVQRLIELKKTPYFETAIYPVEPHGFKEPSSWLDEYTRIDKLFESHLR